ncbi:hypothetical protein V2E29_06790 [Streptomyces diastatochromogenes]
MPVKMTATVWVSRIVRTMGGGNSDTCTVASLLFDASGVRLTPG